LRLVFHNKTSRDILYLKDYRGMIAGLLFVRNTSCMWVCLFDAVCDARQRQIRTHRMTWYWFYDFINIYNMQRWFFEKLHLSTCCVRTDTRKRSNARMDDLRILLCVIFFLLPHFFLTQLYILLYDAKRRLEKRNLINSIFYANYTGTASYVPIHYSNIWLFN